MSRHLNRRKRNPEIRCNAIALSKLILEKYLNNRFNAGVAKGREEGKALGREQANEEGQAWYERMVEARERGEEFDEPPPAAPTEDR